MKPEGKIVEGERLYLQYLKPDMVTDKYVDWMNDKEINQYLEARFGCPYTLESVKGFVKEQYENPNCHFFAMMLKDGDVHIGNIKAGPINTKHNFAEVGIVIGDKSQWGKGFASEAISLITDFAFSKLGLHRLDAGCYSQNKGSEKAFLKAGYKHEGVYRKKFLSDGEYVDDILLGKLRDEQ
ncbi:MAG: GNAT family protein [Candidatus Micrarchaeota archaeon]